MKNRRLLILLFVFFAGIYNTFSQEVDSVVVDTANYDDYSDEKIDTLELKQRRTEYLLELKKIPKDTTSQIVVFFNPHFKDKYKNDPDFDYSKTSGGKTFWEKLQERIERLFNILFGWDKNHKIGKASNIAFKVICGIILLIVLYIIVRVIINHEGKWFFQRKNENLDIDVNDLDQLVQYADFEKMIAETEGKGDTRQSIRLYYLWLLRTLKEKKVIEWNPQKTNADYQNEIKNEEIKEKFTYLSYLYNYIWYGEFSITDNDYLNAKRAFLTYIKSNGNNG